MSKKSHNKFDNLKEETKLNGSIQDEEEIMATSSIFANFDIKDKKTARAFVKALEASAKGATRPATEPPCKLLHTPEEIRQFFSSIGSMRGK